MKHLNYSLLLLASAFGCDIKKTGRAIKGISPFISNFFTLRRQQKESNIYFPVKGFYPNFDDRFQASGSASGHYFHQDLLVAQKIFYHQPEKHADVGSRLDGFVSHVAVFREIHVFDIRPLTSTTSNIVFQQIDIMGKVDEVFEYQYDSLSCLHAAEHFGLGRYGDPVRFNGYLIGLKNMYKMLKPGGKFYFSVPIGKQKIVYNGHRIFSLSYLLSLFDGQYMIDSVSYVDDTGNLHENVILDEHVIENNLGCSFGLGILEMSKL